MSERIPQILVHKATETVRTVAEELMSRLQPSVDPTETQASWTHQPSSGRHNVIHTLSKFAISTGTSTAFVVQVFRTGMKEEIYERCIYRQSLFSQIRTEILAIVASMTGVRNAKSATIRVNRPVWIAKSMAGRKLHAANADITIQIQPQNTREHQNTKRTLPIRKKERSMTCELCITV